MIDVIIVDDEILARTGIKSFLDSARNITVRGCFNTAVEAIEFLDKHQGVDIVITDIEMPEMNGLQFIEQINGQHLALGTIIISSHDKFEYARKALELEADCYLLKTEVSGERILQEIEKIYHTKRKLFAEKSKGKDWLQIFEPIEEPMHYYVGVLKIAEKYDAQGNRVPYVMNEEMIDNLLAGIVEGIGYGELFVQHNRERFLILQFPDDMEAGAAEQIAEDICHALSQAVHMYTNHEVVIGFSDSFKDLKQVPEFYQRALKSVELGLYDKERPLYYKEQQITRESPECHLSTDNFLNDNGLELFRAELLRFLNLCKAQYLDVEQMRQTLLSNMSIFIYRVLCEYKFPVELIEKWNNESRYYSVIAKTGQMEPLIGNLMNVVEEFRTSLLTQLKEDEFQDVFAFVNKHIKERITVAEMAEFKSMSTASFCKKFKERTGLTFIQYLNAQRVEQVKQYIRNDYGTMEHIAEKAGFCNENYMIRVFKKVTGQTVTEFKNAVGK